MKKRKVFILLGLLILLLVAIVTIVTVFLVQQNENKKMISKIKESYSEFVTPTDTKTIYQKIDDQYEKIGTVEKGTILPLIEKKIGDKDDIYYQIKDTNYYIDYQDLKEVKDYQENIELDSYLVTTKIQTMPTNLYQDEKRMITLEEQLEFDVLLKDNDHYYVKFLNDIYYIKDNYELKELENIETLQDISVLNFSNDLSLEQFQKIIQYLKEENYETITVSDFKRWVSGGVNLGKNKVLLLSNQELNEEKKQIIDECQFTVNTSLEEIEFASGDTKLKIGDTRYYQYEVTSNTSLDRVKDMLNGVKEVKVTSQGQGVAVLNYHFFYDGSQGEACNETICLDVSNFRKQLDYLKANNFKILTMQEFNDWMDRKITLPQKSVLITIDDGAMGTSAINGNKLIPILEEYQVPATLFLITGWWDVANYQSNYLEIHSHGDELHHGDYCNSSGRCGAKGVLISKEELVADLRLSSSKIGSNLAFCYPFYAKNNTMVEAIKETGFSLAFVGGNRKARQTDDKYAIPRYVIYKDTSLNGFISMVG